MKTKITSVFVVSLMWVFLALFYWRVSWTFAIVVGLVISAISLILMKLDDVDKAKKSIELEKMKTGQEWTKEKSE